MPRRLRCAEGGHVYHVLNRAVGRAKLFKKESDYAAFENVLCEALDWQPTRLLTYCLMPNHWHLIVWPREDGELSQFMRWLTVTHTQRWHAHHGTSGTGPLYQGRFKAFPVQDDDHYFRVCRYVERNALRANLVARAQEWRWSRIGLPSDAVLRAKLSAGPLPLPTNWRMLVNRPQTEAELSALRLSVTRSRPYGSDAWTQSTAKSLGLESTLRPRGRPRIDNKEKQQK